MSRRLRSVGVASTRPRNTRLAATTTLASSVPTSPITTVRRFCAYRPSFSSTTLILARGQTQFPIPDHVKPDVTADRRGRRARGTHGALTFGASVLDYFTTGLIGGSIPWMR